MFKTERSAVIAAVVAITVTTVAAIVSLAAFGRNDIISQVLGLVAPVEAALLVLLRVSDASNTVSEIAQNTQPGTLHDVTSSALSQVLDEKATVQQATPTTPAATA